MTLELYFCIVGNFEQFVHRDRIIFMMAAMTDVWNDGVAFIGRNDDCSKLY